MAAIFHKTSRFLALGVLFLGFAAGLPAQSVGLPAPRLLTTTPMGGKVGTDLEISITGDFLDDAGELIFSDSRIKATPKKDSEGKVVPDKYQVKIDKACPPGLYEARVITRLGISSSRVFVVGTLDEVLETKPNNTLASAIEVPINSVCNGTVADRAIDYLAFQAKKGQRVVVDCATRGIDSKLNATVIIGDEAGRDLLVERRGGVLDFTAPKDGKYTVKIHELTFKGGPAFYYRLGLWEQKPGMPIERQAETRAVNAFSWPPAGLAKLAALAEVEPNQPAGKIQKISLPADISGSFYPAADVDIYEFQAKKGEVWWVELASERLGRPTDASALVQQVVKSAEGEKLVDVLELTDIPSPVKVSSNGYAYDGPPYNSGTSDFIGKLEIKEDGVYRLQ
ncbi:MAG: serine protease, partial [Isosphaeraceae bacterium]